MEPALLHNPKKLLELARQSGFSARVLSQLLKISPRQLRRYTRDFFGCSPQAWLNRQRFTLATELLQEYRCVKTVSFHLGFKRLSHFSRNFKLAFGVCPTAYLAGLDRRNPGPDNPVPPADSAALQRGTARA